MDAYIAWTESHEEPTVNIWAFITAVILLILNLWGKQLKNDYQEEYAVRKIVESFFCMEIENEGADSLDLDAYYNSLLEEEK